MLIGNPKPHLNDWPHLSSSDPNATPMKIPQDFAEFLQCLNDEGAHYLVVGGYAVCFYGHPRYTGDIDIWVGNDAGNATRVAAALRRFGFDLPDVNPQTFMQEDVVVHMGVEPLRIEIFTHQPGVVFDACNLHAVKETISGVEARFIGLDDLKCNKKASGRLKDLADLEELP